MITDETTRRRVVAGVLQESTLDQVFSSESAIVSSLNMLAPLGKSDHSSILLNLNVSADSHNNNNNNNNNNNKI